MSASITMLAIANIKKDASLNTIQMTVKENAVTKIAEKGTEETIQMGRPANLRKSVNSNT